MHKSSTISLLTLGLLGLAGCAQESAPTGSAPAADAAPAAATAAPAQMATGNPEAGKRIYIYCQSCHSINEGGPNKVGPNLHGIFDSPAAQVDGFAYSTPLTESGVVWTAAALDQWVTSPSSMVPGTTMLFAGVNEPQQRADLIAYMQQMSAAQK